MFFVSLFLGEVVAQDVKAQIGEFLQDNGNPRHVNKSDHKTHA